jgi:hypothetical protein
MICSLQKSLAEFAARTPRNHSNPFFPAACTSEKTLLGQQVCPQGARSRPQSTKKVACHFFQNYIRRLMRRNGGSIYDHRTAEG